MSAKPHAQATGEVVSLRRYTVGGSDAAAAAGIHPYTSPVMLWLEKTGRIDRGETEAMKWGTLLQEVVALDLAHEYDVDPGPVELIDPDRPWLVCHPDGFCTLDGYRSVLEVKTAGHWSQAARGGEVPVEYAAQCQMYMHTAGLDRAFLACLVGGQRLETRVVYRSDKAIGYLLEACERFHHHLITDTQPPPDGHPATREALLHLYPEAVKDRRVRLTKQQMEWLTELKALRARKTAIEDQMAGYENKLRAALEDAEVAISPTDAEVIHYRHHNVTRLDTKRLKAERPDVERDYGVTTTQRRFQIV